MTAPPTNADPPSSSSCQTPPGAGQQQQSWAESLIIAIPGLCHPIHAFFPPSILSKCQLCKDKFIDRDTCRIRHKHTRLPWNNTFLCITIDPSAFLLVENDDIITDSSSSSLCRRYLPRDQVYVAKPSLAAYPQQHSAGGIILFEHQDQQEEPKRVGAYFATRPKNAVVVAPFTTTTMKNEGDTTSKKEAREWSQQHLLEQNSNFIFTETSEMLVNARSRVTTSSRRITKKNQGERGVQEEVCKSNNSIETSVNSTSDRRNTQHHHADDAVRLGACSSCTLNNYSRNKCRHKFKHMTVPHSTIHLTLEVATPEERSTLEKLCLERQETTDFLHYNSKREIYDVESAQINLSELERNDSFSRGLHDSDTRPSDTFFVSLFVSAPKTKVEWLDFNIHKITRSPVSSSPKKNKKSSSPNPAVPPALTYIEHQKEQETGKGGARTDKNNNKPLVLLQQKHNKEEGTTGITVLESRKKKRIRARIIANESKKKTRVQSCPTSSSNSISSTARNSDEEEDARLLRTAVKGAPSSGLVVVTVEHRCASNNTTKNINNNEIYYDEDPVVDYTNAIATNRKNVNNNCYASCCYHHLTPPSLLRPPAQDEINKRKNDSLPPAASGIIVSQEYHHLFACSDGQQVCPHQQSFSAAGAGTSSQFFTMTEDESATNHTMTSCDTQQQEHNGEDQEIDQPQHVCWENDSSAPGQQQEDITEDEWCALAPPEVGLLSDVHYQINEENEETAPPPPEGLLSSADELFPCSSWMPGHGFEDSSFLNDYSAVWDKYLEVTEHSDGLLGNNVLDLLSEEDNGVFYSAENESRNEDEGSRRRTIQNAHEDEDEFSITQQGGSEFSV